MLELSEVLLIHPEQAKKKKKKKIVKKHKSGVNGSTKLNINESEIATSERKNDSNK